jgi:hypothetical protein
VLLVNECLFLLLFISLSTQSGNFWIHPRISQHKRVKVKEKKGVLGRWKYSSTHSLTSAVDRGEWSASRPGSFTSSEEPLGVTELEKGSGIEAGETGMINHYTAIFS